MNLGIVGGFFLVAAIIGLFELFDRTSFALIALSARSRPFPTWAGGAVAFVASSAIAVSVGAALVAALGPGRVGLVRVVGGLVLVGYAAWLCFHPEEERAPDVGTARSAFTAALVTVLLLELADSTMILEIVFVATWGWLVVLVAGSLALVTVAAVAVTLGSKLGSRIDPELMRRIVVAVLLLVGIVTIVYGLFPQVFPRFA